MADKHYTVTSGEKYTTAEKLSVAIDLYRRVLYAQRRAEAGYDYSNVDHEAEEAAIPNYDEAIYAELKLHNLDTSEKLAASFLADGVDRARLDLIQTPYFEKPVSECSPDQIGHYNYGKNAWTQISNPDYGKAVAGIGFDDVYAINYFFGLLRKNDNDVEGRSFADYNEKSVIGWKLSKDREQRINDRLEYINKVFGDITKNDFWRDAKRPFNWTYIGMIDILSKSLYDAAEKAEGKDYQDRRNILIDWYFDNAEGNSDVNWRYYVKKTGEIVA